MLVAKSVWGWALGALLVAAVAATGGGLALFYYLVSGYDGPRTQPGLFVALHPVGDGYHASAYGLSEYYGRRLRCITAVGAWIPP